MITWWRRRNFGLRSQIASILSTRRIARGRILFTLVTLRNTRRSFRTMFWLLLIVITCFRRIMIRMVVEKGGNYLRRKKLFSVLPFLARRLLSLLLGRRNRLRKKRRMRRRRVRLVIRLSRIMVSRFHGSPRSIILVP